MLVSLSIKNFIIIESARIEFNAGMSVITGETGAGKSILIQALRLALGDKTSSDVIRAGSNEAEIEAVFFIKDKKVLSLIEESGIPLDDNILIIRRIISQKGNRLYLNDKACTLSLLHQISKKIISMCSQFENHNLFDQGYQLNLIDSFVPQNIINSYEEKYREYVSIKKDFDLAKSLLEEKEKKLDYLYFQSEEIKSISPKEKEDETLEAELGAIDKNKNIYELCSYSNNAFYGEGESIIQKLESLQSKMNKIDEPSVNELRDHLIRLLQDAELIADQLKKIRKNVNYNPNLKNQIYDRLELLKKIKKKFGPTIDIVLKKKKEIQLEIEKLENSEAFFKKTRDKLNKSLLELKEVGQELSNCRIKSAKEFSDLITKQLQELNMKGSKLNIQILSEPEEPGITGFDKAVFLFTPNKGEKEGELKEIASGGELSRVTLAIHKTINQKTDSKTYIFDEVDSGIGGDTGKVIGKKLKEISKNSQIICITHLAQVASFGEAHFKIEKHEDKDRVFTKIYKIDKPEDKIKEIARMMTGDSLKKEALAHAETLLKDSLKNN